jgi:glycosyltransferase involved in cell wall biosynthesis
MYKNPLRILMLVPHLGIKGPLPKHAPLIVEALRERGCEVVTYGWGRHQDKETLKQKLVGRLRDIINIRKILLKERTDALVVKTTHNWTALSRDIPLLLFTGHLCHRVILQLHGSQPNLLISPDNVIFKMFTKWLMRLSDAALVLSSEEQRQWQHFYPNGKFYVVSNPFVPRADEIGTAFDLPWNIPPGKPVLLFAGRLIREKGIFELLEAVANVNTLIPCHLIIAGDGPLEQQVRQRIADLDLGESVTLAGYLIGGQLSGVYHRANIFVLPTYFYEGFPTVISEAMNVGLPIVTTRLRGAADYLEDGTHVIFVPPKNPSAVADAIVRLLDDKALRERMAQANREKVLEFAPDRVGKQYLDILKDVIETTPAGIF